MKKLIAFAASALVLAGCSQDEFEGSNLESQTNEITFSMSTPATTRANLTGADAAAKLSNKFIVYGWKTVETTTSDVFKNYLVTWNGNANGTLSNTSGWEYVGNTSVPTSGSGVEQSVKYWDYNASQYDFLAWSGGVSLKEIKTLTAEERKEGEVGNVYKEKALHFEPDNVDEAASIYIANQVTVAKSAYKNEVEFNFRNLASKVRVGIFETIPGYSVKNVKFYTSADGSATTDGYTYLFSGSDVFLSKATVTVKYRTSNNEAVVFSSPTAKATYAQLGIFTPAADPEYKESGNFVGRTSTDATFGTTSNEGGWCYVYPTEAGALTLKVDYTLVAKDGSGETIDVTGATATIPEQYTAWKANYAYTYLFKISDKTNGKPGEGAPEGLYPITFDAVVTSVEDGNTQEVVTTVSEATISTYQNGSALVGNSSFTSGKNIWVSVIEGSASKELKADNTKLYTAVSLDSKLPLTEANVANYKNNAILLTDVSNSLTFTNKIDETIDGVNIPFDGTTNYVAKFTPSNNKVYVVEFKGTAGSTYKIVKVGTGTPSATYALTGYKPGTTEVATAVAEGGMIDVKLTENGLAVTGAQNFFNADAFTIVETSTAGTYRFIAKAGEADPQTVTINSASTTISIIPFEFASNVAVVAGETCEITLNCNGAAATEVDDYANFTVNGTGLSITDVTDGKVTISAEKSAKSGTIEFWNGGVVVASATVTVNNYSFTANRYVVNVGGIDADKKTTLKMYINGGLALGKDVTKDVDDTYATLSATKIEAIHGDVSLTAIKVPTSGKVKVSAPDDSYIEIEVKNFKVEFFTTEGCTTAETPAAGATCYVRFTDNGVTTSSAIDVAEGTLTSTATVGVYKYVAPAASTADEITYEYKGVTFTLFSKTF